MSLEAIPLSRQEVLLAGGGCVKRRSCPEKLARDPLTGLVAVHIIHNSEKRFLFYEWTFAEKHIKCWGTWAVA